MTVSLVTGGNRGIGFEVCRQLAAAGHGVLLAARSLDAAERAAEELGRGVRPVRLDVTSAEDVGRRDSRVHGVQGRAERADPDAGRRTARRRRLGNAVCPGWVATDMGGPGGRPVADGAASVVWAEAHAADFA